MTARGGKRYAIIADVCAFANTNGGTLYIGLTSDPKKPVVGVPDAEHAISQLEKEINKRISPPLQCGLDVHDVAGQENHPWCRPHVAVIRPMQWMITKSMCARSRDWIGSAG